LVIIPFLLEIFSKFAIDPDDLIFPRTATRIGTKYQANVPSAPGIDSLPSGIYFFSNPGGRFLKSFQILKREAVTQQ